MRKRRGYIESKKKDLIKLLFLILIASFSILLIILFSKNKNKIENVIIEENIENNISNKVKYVKNERIEKLKKIQEENSDIVAWLEIEGSKINYPVVQTNNNSFYMTNNYKKEYSKDGSLFLDKDYDWKLPSTNLLIYGHNNIGSTEMFAGLINYKDQSYYNTHKTIRLTTNNEDAVYEIIAVFLSRVYYKSEKNVFRYYDFINAQNEQEFNEYVENSKKASLYNIDTTAQYGDQLLTLSTCSYHTEDGRLAVVAKKVKK